MIREIDLKEVSDGKLYGPNDMVKADCSDCRGCSACCQGMGNSVILDPLDIHRMASGMGMSFEELLDGRIELNIADGVILPNLNMTGEGETCAFLDEAQRCSIHPHRPGICRIFPLGRLYEEHGFRYFLQIHECKNTNRTKVKVKKWVDTSEYKKYETFVSDWHSILSDVRGLINQNLDESLIKSVNMYILNSFYLEAFHREQDFYEQFAVRMKSAREFIMGARNKESTASTAAE